ncbi:MAG: 50S ribosomal protein L29 [Acidobacteria bacterium]|nr:50S ribosomal protein L29 [Acidobacteriota bacterium]
MKANLYREKTVEELRGEEKSLRQQILRIRFQSAAGNVENPVKVRTIRHDLARILTILREKKDQKTPSA